MSCENPSGDTDSLMPRRLRYDKSKTCVKCKQQVGNIVMRHAVYCKACFIPLITFRFRKALEPHINAKPDGPRRTALRPTGNLLVGFSGGLGSSVLLDLVNRCYVSPDESLVTTEGGRDHPRHERVWKKVTVCYIEQCGAFSEMQDRTDDIRRTVASCPGVEFLSLRLEDAFDPLWWKMNGFTSDLHPLKVTLGDDALPYAFASSQSSADTPTTALRRYLASLPTPTALDATVKTLTRVLLQYTAAATGSSHLVLGTTLTSLAVHLISSVSHGGGFHIKEETQEEWTPATFSVSSVASDAGPDRPSTPHIVRIIRPLRDVGRKECAAWSWWMHLKIAGREDWQWPGTKPGVGRLTKDFIFGLEKDYPSTVSTIVRTCAKLAPKGDKAGYCVSCQRPIQYGVQDWKERIAIRSRYAHSGTAGDSASAETTEHLSRYLCYVCHTNLTSKSARPLPSLYADIGDYQEVTSPVWISGRIASLTGTIASLGADKGPSASRPMSREAMRDKVKDFLLDD